MIRKISIVLVIAALLIAGCSEDDDNPGSSGSASSGVFPLTIEQTDGEDITLDKAPARIVSLAANATEIICALGAGDQLVAVEKFENCPSGSNSKPSVDAFQPNLEAVAAYNPDLVFTTYNPSGFVESLRRLNIPVIFLDVPANIAGVYDSIELFGDITGKEAAADELVSAMKKRQDAVTSKIGSSTGPSVYHELDNTYYTAAPQSFVGDFYKLLKASNIAEGASSDYPQLSAEVIIQRNPQVIVLADEEAGVTVASVKARAGWDVVDAVKNDRICTINPDIVSRPGPRVVDAMEELAECLYPDKF